MPYLQLDVPRRYSAEVKQRLAEELAVIFARMMQTARHKVVVAFRELPDGSVWRCGEGAPELAAVLTCDIRRGRPPEQRARLAEALIHACSAALDLRAESLSVQFSQHAGDEVFRLGQGLGSEWTPAEAQTLA